MLSISILLVTLQAQNSIQPSPENANVVALTQPAVADGNVPSEPVAAPHLSGSASTVMPSLAELFERRRENAASYRSLRQRQQDKSRAAAIWTGVGGTAIGLPLLVLTAQSYFQSVGLGWPFAKPSLTFLQSFAMNFGRSLVPLAIVAGVAVVAITIGCIFAAEGSALNAEIEAARIRLMNSENTLTRARSQVTQVSVTMSEAPSALTFGGTF
jgi:hypothetical protein